MSDFSNGSSGTMLNAIPFNLGELSFQGANFGINGADSHIEVYRELVPNSSRVYYPIVGIDGNFNTIYRIDPQIFNDMTRRGDVYKIALYEGSELIRVITVHPDKNVHGEVKKGSITFTETKTNIDSCIG